MAHHGQRGTRRYAQVDGAQRGAAAVIHRHVPELDLTAYGGAAMDGCSRRMSLMRARDALPRCIRLTTHPSAIMGHTSMPMYVLNITKLPTEMRPANTCWPPTHSTTRNVTPISASNSGWNRPCTRTSRMFCAM